MQRTYTNGTANPGHANHISYASSSEGSYGQIQTHSRSESGTSPTQYDEFYATPPSKSLIQDFARPDMILNGSRHGSRDYRKSLRVRQSDPMAMHLLLETALGDSQHYDVLSLEELEDIKKEEQTLARKTQARRKKLFLESRMHSTARSLQKLDSTNGTGTTADQTPVTSQKCAELAEDLWRLEKRQTELQDRRLKHTAGVLQLNHQLQSQTGTPRALDGAVEHEDGMSPLDGVMGFLGGADHLAPRLHDVSQSLYDIISGKSKVNQNLDFPAPARPGTAAEDEVAYIEHSLNTVRGLHDGLTTYLEDTRQKGRSLEQEKQETTVLLQRLWHTVGAGAQDLDRNKQAMRGLGATSRVLDQEPEDIFNPSEPFSVQALSARVEKLCTHASHISTEHLLNTQSVQSRAAELDGPDAASGAKPKQLAVTESEREELQSEIIRLQTELTISRAELDGAYGTRAQRAAGGPMTNRDMEDLAAKNVELAEAKSELEKELSDLVNAHEGMVRQLIEAEKERESLEGVADSHKERIEELERSVSDGTINAMGRTNGTNGSTAVKDASETPRPPDSTSVGVMRQEFKKMMREMRADHFRAVKVRRVLFLQSPPLPLRG